jgi:hypothetical protein
MACQTTSLEGTRTANPNIVQPKTPTPSRLSGPGSARFTCLLDFRDCYYARSWLLDHLDSDGFLNCYCRSQPVSCYHVASGNPGVSRRPPTNQYCVFPSCIQEFGGKSGGKIGTARQAAPVPPRGPTPTLDRPGAFARETGGQRKYLGPKNPS